MVIRSRLHLDRRTRLTCAGNDTIYDCKGEHTPCAGDPKECENQQSTQRAKWNEYVVDAELVDQKIGPNSSWYRSGIQDGELIMMVVIIRF